ncbi:hypothetical protein [Abyssibius alkaniclasticus]|uniref:hypothetical protein n=1 Tax=Abyssibius alkaniclasticus TaxID=2881234 RepID=UPI004059A5C0
MTVTWFARTVCVLLALGLAGNALAGQMQPGRMQEQSMVSAALDASVCQPSTMYKCTGFQTCVNGHGGSGGCGVFIASFRDQGWSPANPMSLKTKVPSAGVFLPAQALDRLFRPPRG